MGMLVQAWVELKLDGWVERQTEKKEAASQMVEERFWQPFVFQYLEAHKGIHLRIGCLKLCIKLASVGWKMAISFSEFEITLVDLIKRRALCILRKTHDSKWL
jgi:hypothetical protein